ncbi:MAG: phosphate ABC transporter permease PstA [Planctomycetaceae bacterium]|nr:phosphate ABC transporter permease PstA [Planctomycetaceae bacterium]
MSSNKLDLYTTKPRGRMANFLFTAFCFLATLTCILMLLVLIWNIILQGKGWLSWDFIDRLPSRFPHKAGIKTALYGSIWLIALTALFSVPLGVGAAVDVEEYAPKNRWRRLIQLNISNLAGVPSIVYGILGLGLFVRALAFDRSVLSGALTLTLVVLPIIILASQEALRSVPDSIRRSAYALGATRWQTVWYQVLPASLPGIMTGVILALSRALGEAAPLIVVGAAAYVPFVPEKLSDEFTSLPIQIFNWSARPQEEFHHLAAAGILVLLIVLVSMNAIAVFMRHKYGKKIRW